MGEQHSLMFSFAYLFGNTTHNNSSVFCPSFGLLFWTIQPTGESLYSTPSNISLICRDFHLLALVVICCKLKTPWTLFSLSVTDKNAKGAY